MAKIMLEGQCAGGPGWWQHVQVGLLSLTDRDGVGWEAGRHPRFHGHESRVEAIAEGGARQVECGLGDSVVLLVAGDDRSVSESL